MTEGRKSAVSASTRPARKSILIRNRYGERREERGERREEREEGEKKREKREARREKRESRERQHGTSVHTVPRITAAVALTNGKTSGTGQACAAWPDAGPGWRAWP